MSPERSVTYVSERTLCLSNHLTKSPATTEVQLGPKFRHSTAARGTPQISAHLHYSVCVSHCGASVRLPQAVLSGCHGYSQLIHDGGVAMPESMEARAGCPICPEADATFAFGRCRCPTASPCLWQKAGSAYWASRFEGNRADD